MAQRGPVYPNDEIEITHPGMFVFSTLGYSRNKIFITGLNEYSTPDNLPFVYRSKSPNSSGSIFTDWEQGRNLVQLSATNAMDNDAYAGGKIQITTPKGSFIVTFVDR